MKIKFSTVRWPLKPLLTGKVGSLEDAGTCILDKMPRLNAKGTLCNSTAKLCSSAHCAVNWNWWCGYMCFVWSLTKLIVSMAGIFGLA